MASVWIVVRTEPGSAAGVYAEDAELDARRLAVAPHHELMRVAVTPKARPASRLRGRLREFRHGPG